MSNLSDHLKHSVRAFRNLKMTSASWNYFKGNCKLHNLHNETLMLKHHADFLSYLNSEKGSSKNTIEAYERDSLRFLKFINKSIKKISEADVIRYLSHLNDKGYASSSRHRNLMVIKSFFKFLLREGVISDNPAKVIECPKQWNLIPEVLSYDEIVQLLDQPDTTNFNGIRDKAILEMLYATGMRVSELCEIKATSYQPDGIKIMGKGRKERIVPIGKKAIACLDEYLSYFTKRDKLLFRQLNGIPITRQFVWRIIRNYSEGAGITKRISPHTLRHTFATHLLKGGADIRVIQDLLGHESINSTERYMQISQDHMIDCFNNFHPRA